MILTTLQKYKAAIQDTSSDNDLLHVESLEAASDVVRDYCDRDFGAAIVNETRSYMYDGSGVLEIDDATDVDSVTIAPSSTPLPAGSWRADVEGPAGVPYSFIWMPVYNTRVSGEMGFMYNLDVYLASLPPNQPVDLTVNVTADYGYPDVPNAVQRAAIWIASSFEQDPLVGAGGIASKSVAEVATAYVQSQEVTDEPIPKRARFMLDPYRRHPG